MSPKKILPIILPPVLVLSIDVVCRPLYGIWQNFDVFMHTLGGVTITISVIHAKKLFKIEKESWWYHTLTTVGLVTLAATFWEFYEFIRDEIDQANNILYTRQPSIADTMDDYKNAILGSIATLVFYKRK